MRPSSLLAILTAAVLCSGAALLAHAREYRHRAIVCSAADGTSLRIETEVARDADGRPRTEDEGFARMMLFGRPLEGTFDREGDYYHFRFPGQFVTIARQGGAAFAYTAPADPNKVAMMCRPVAL